MEKTSKGTDKICQALISIYSNAEIGLETTRSHFQILCLSQNATFPKNKTKFSEEETNLLFRLFWTLFDQCSQLNRGELAKDILFLQFAFDLFFYINSRAKILPINELLNCERSETMVQKYETVQGVKLNAINLLQEYFKFLVNAVGCILEELKLDSFTPFCAQIWLMLRENKMFEFDSKINEFPFCFSETISLIRLISENKKYIQQEIPVTSLFNLSNNIIDWILTSDIPTEKSLIEKLIIRLVKIMRNIIFSKTQIKLGKLIPKILTLINQFPDCKEICVDSFRIISKLSENKQYAAEIPIDELFLTATSSTLIKFCFDHYLTGLNLHFINNMISFRGYYKNIVDSRLMTNLLAIFELYSEKVN